MVSSTSFIPGAIFYVIGLPANCKHAVSSGLSIERTYAISWIDSDTNGYVNDIAKVSTSYSPVKHFLFIVLKKIATLLCR